MARISYQRVFFWLMLAFGVLLRTVLLNEVPPGLANDEANVILNGQSIAKTGSNIPGVVTGIFGTPTGNYISGAHSELSSYFLSFFYLFTGFSIFTAKFPFVAASLGVVIFTYLIAKEFLNKYIAVIVLLLSAVNPWLIHFGRVGYESIISSFFYMASIYVFLKTDKWKTLYTVPLLLAGFLSYFSAKVILLPLSISFIILSVLLRPKKSLKPVVVLNVFLVIFLILYTMLLQKSYPGERLKELKSKSFAQTVDHNRTHSIKNPFEKIVENKYVENFYYRTNAALGGMSTTFLFLNGMPESSGHLSVPDHGPLYPIDLIMAIIGFIYLSRYYTKKAIGLSCLAAITFLPNFVDIGNTTYSMRPVILIPVLIIFSASGVYGIYKYLSGSKLRLAFIGITVLLYLFFVARFIFQYYYRLPIESNDSWFFQDRVASHYIQALQTEKPEMEIVWLAPFYHFTFYRYIYFSRLYTTTQNIKQINGLLEKGIYKLGNVVIQDTCPKDYNTDSTFYIIDPVLSCDAPKTVAIIANIDDVGVKYRFVNDPLCQKYMHNRYPYIKSHRLLDVEKLSTEEFCVNYISNNQE